MSKLHVGDQSREPDERQLSDTHTHAGDERRLVEMEESSSNLFDGFLFPAPKIRPVGAKPCGRVPHHLCWRRPQEEEKVGSCHLDFPSLAGWGWRSTRGRGVNY